MSQYRVYSFGHDFSQFRFCNFSIELIFQGQDEVRIFSRWFYLKEESFLYNISENHFKIDSAQNKIEIWTPSPSDTGPLKRREEGWEPVEVVEEGLINHTYFEYM